MASKAMWEVDPETRSKLLAIQKESKNNLCCDCSAPSPQWASPKFGIFICLSCAGVHRGLGVHISFVRSISMDAFKATEIERMRLGGNEAWRTFFETHEDTKMRGLAWDDATIAERYSGEAGEEWKERLSARVEGREYVPGERRKATSATPSPAPGQTAAGNNSGGGAKGGGARSATPRLGGSAANSRTASPSPGVGGGSGKVKVDDRYFARLGADNASRPDGLPPSQGGKYSGFGNTPMPAGRPQGGAEALPGLDELQRDPVAALSKGFGWFTSTVSRTAKTVNDDFIQPTAKQIADSEFAAQARAVGGNVAKTAQQGARTAQESLNRFVEGGPPGGRHEYSAVPIDESKKGFWDDFASIAEQKQQQQQQRKPGGSAIGTAAMGKGGSRGAGPAAAGSKAQDEWDDW